MGFRWIRTPRQAWSAAIITYEQRLLAAFYERFQFYAAEIEADMKVYADWTDRTANARQTLEARAFWIDKTVGVVAYQQMDYGVFLELANGGRFAIVMPTLQLYYRPIWADVKRGMKAGV